MIYRVGRPIDPGTRLYPLLWFLSGRATLGFFVSLRVHQLFNYVILRATLPSGRCTVLIAAETNRAPSSDPVISINELGGAEEGTSSYRVGFFVEPRTFSQGEQRMRA